MFRRWRERRRTRAQRRVMDALIAHNMPWVYTAAVADWAGLRLLDAFGALCQLEDWGLVESRWDAEGVRHSWSVTDEGRCYMQRLAAILSGDLP